MLTANGDVSAQVLQGGTQDKRIEGALPVGNDFPCHLHCQTVDRYVTMLLSWQRKKRSQAFVWMSDDEKFPLSLSQVNFCGSCAPFQL